MPSLKSKNDFMSAEPINMTPSYYLVPFKDDSSKQINKEISLSIRSEKPGGQFHQTNI